MLRCLYCANFRLRRPSQEYLFWIQNSCDDVKSEPAGRAKMLTLFFKIQTSATIPYLLPRLLHCIDLLASRGIPFVSLVRIITLIRIESIRSIHIWHRSEHIRSIDLVPSSQVKSSVRQKQKRGTHQPSLVLGLTQIIELALDWPSFVPGIGIPTLLCIDPTGFQLCI